MGDNQFQRFDTNLESSFQKTFLFETTPLIWIKFLDCVTFLGTKLTQAWFCDTLCGRQNINIAKNAHFLCLETNKNKIANYSTCFYVFL